jgi:hypothetical protein
MDSLAPLRRLAALILCLIPISLTGCNIAGIAAQFVGPPDTGAAYTKLKGETVGVLVWVDRGTRLDYPALQSDMAKSLTSKLTELTQPKDKKSKPRPEMEGIQYLSAMSIIRFQEDHPEFDGLPAKDIAIRLGVTRVISIEIKDFRTHSPDSPDIFKGMIAAIVQVIEVTPGPNKVATIGYNNPNMEITYPPNQPEGIPFGNVSPQMIYDKSIDQFTTDVALLFFRHAAKD